MHFFVSSSVFILSMRWILLSYLLITSCVCGQLSVPANIAPSTELVLSFRKRNEKIREVRIPEGSTIEIALRAPDDSLITFYDHTIEGKLTHSTDSTVTIAVTSVYRYINYRNGSWLEDLVDHPADTGTIQTFQLDSITSIYSNREWLSNHRKVCMNLTRIFIGVSTINNLAGKGNLTNTILFGLGLIGVGGEFAIGGKTFWLEPPIKRSVYPRRIWKVHAE